VFLWDHALGGGHLSLSLSLSLCYLAQAGIDFVPHPGYDVPLYFSGTNSRAFYRASVSPPHNHIAVFELYLNDILTLQLNTPCVPGPRNPYLAVQEGAVMFDSFYFAYPLSTITVKCRVKAETYPGGSSEWFEHTYSAPSKNAAALFGYWQTEGMTGGNTVAVATAKLGEVQYPCIGITYYGWTFDNYASLIAENRNVVHHHSHGNALGVTDGCAIWSDPEGIWYGNDIWGRQEDGWPSIEAMRIQQMGSGLPPYNSTQKPPINLAVHMSCLNVVGNESTCVTFLYPYSNTFVNYSENQSFISWRIKVKIADTAELTEHLFEALVSGLKAIETAQYMIDNAPTNNYIYEHDDAHAVADGEARLRRVYDPTSALLRWWRPIALP
jgi:hypothetical protein